MAPGPDQEEVYQPTMQDDAGKALIGVGTLVSTVNPAVGIPIVAVGGALARKELGTKANWIISALRRSRPS